MIRTCPGCGCRHDHLPDDIEPCGSCLPDTWACALGRALRAFVQRAERDTLDAVLRATTATLERVTRDLAAVTRERDEARAALRALSAPLTCCECGAEMERVATACDACAVDVTARLAAAGRLTRERDEARADVVGLRRLLEAVSTACQPASADELDAARMEAEAARAERDAMRATLDRAVRLLHALAAPGGRQP